MKIGDKVKFIKILDDNVDEDKYVNHLNETGFIIECLGNNILYPYKVKFENGDILFLAENEIIVVEENDNEIISKWKEEIDKIDRCEQRQDSTVEQLNDLIYVANKLGFYDASDWIKERM